MIRIIYILTRREEQDITSQYALNALTLVLTFSRDRVLSVTRSKIGNIVLAGSAKEN